MHPSDQYPPEGEASHSSHAVPPTSVMSSAYPSRRITRRPNTRLHGTCHPTTRFDRPHFQIWANNVSWRHREACCLPCGFTDSIWPSPVSVVTASASVSKCRSQAVQIQIITGGVNTDLAYRTGGCATWAQGSRPDRWVHLVG
jgi:hypothetical protein